MRMGLYLLCCLMVLASGYWAYSENYETQAALRRVNALKAQIDEKREAIAVLTAEWAYLNRPDRLRDLVELNFADLQLLEILPDHYADVELVAYPDLSVPKVDYNNPVAVQSNGGQD